MQRKKFQSHPSLPTGLPANVAAMLCYSCPLTFITGIIFLLIEKENRDVRFHAWQAVFLGVVALVVLVALSILAAIMGVISAMLASLMGIIVFGAALSFAALWVVCMVKAYQGERYQLPFIGAMAEQQALL